MKVRIEKEVSIASAFQHLIAAWDMSPYSWYREVRYTNTGERAIGKDAEPVDDAKLLAWVRMDHESSDGPPYALSPEDVYQHVHVTGRWIADTLAKCIELGGAPARAAMQIINEDPSADQNTADLVVQVGAYGRVVFG